MKLFYNLILFVLILFYKIVEVLEEDDIIIRIIFCYFEYIRGLGKKSL